MAVEEKASDVHLKADRLPYFRVNGDIVTRGSLEVKSEDVDRFLAEITDPEERAALEKDWELDLGRSFDIGGRAIRFRINIHRQRSGWGLVLRILSDSIPCFERITLESSIQNLARLSRGLVLVTGPTGSGKSTTLASLMNWVNTHQPKHLYSIEDPIEYVYEPQRSEVTQRELGRHTHSFTAALKTALRADPDVILVGEMRDLETIQLALTAAETGHLVFSTLHTCDTTQTVDRVIDVFPAAQQAMVRSQLANVLQGIITQVLLPKADGSGRIAAREILLATTAMRTQIRENKTHQMYGLISGSVQQGMCPLELALAVLVRSGEVEEAVASAVVNRLPMFESYMAAPKLPMRPAGVL